VAGGKITSASDVYSLGVMFYELLTGEKLFDDANPFVVMKRHQEEDPSLLIKEKVPGKYRFLFASMLAKNPGERPSLNDLMVKISGVPLKTGKLRWEDIREPSEEELNKLTRSLSAAELLEMRAKIFGVPEATEPGGTGIKQPNTLTTQKTTSTLLSDKTRLIFLLLILLATLSFAVIHFFNATQATVNQLSNISSNNQVADNQEEDGIDGGNFSTAAWQKMNAWRQTGSITQPTSDGGYIIAGAGYKGYYLVKLNARGNIDWEWRSRGSGSDTESSVQQTSDGGYIVAGRSKSTDIQGVVNHGGADCYLVKLDARGNIDWQKMYGGNDWDYAESIHQTTDGGYIVAGGSDSTDIPGVMNHGDHDCYLIKLDERGNIDWQKMYGGSSSEFGSSVQQTADGGYIVAIQSFQPSANDLSYYNGDSCLIKLDTRGNMEWKTMYGDSGPSDRAESVQQTSDGGYIVAGISRLTDIPGVMNHGDNDCYLIKLDAKGNIDWQKMYGGGDSEFGSSVQQTSDGGYIVAGRSESTDIPGVMNHGGTDCYLVKLNARGNIDWQKMYGGNKEDEAYSIQQTIDGGYIVDSSTGLIKLDKNGNLKD
jgi:hypothetical protein